SFAISADGKRYAVATMDPPGLGSGKIRVYDASSDKVLQTFPRAELRDLAECALALSADGKLLFSIGRSGVVGAEDVTSGNETVKYGIRVYLVRGMQGSRDGEHVAIADEANLCLWKWRTEQPQAVLTKSDFTGVAFSPDSKKLAVTSERGPRDWAGVRVFET